MSKKFFKPAALLLAAGLILGLCGYAAAENSAPIAQNLELSTYRGVSVGGRLSATDPDGDALSFQITTDPVKGSIDLDDDGHFVYTPESGKRGRDYFGYRATDTSGNRSQEATVIIRIEKQKSSLTYADMSGNSAAYAAQRLAEEGVFTGEILAGQAVFAPDTPVSRSEFLAMCMAVAGKAPAVKTGSTGFADDADIPVWAKPYVSAALTEGIISGYADRDSSAVFAPNDGISVTEAAVILDRSVRLTDAVAAWFGFDDAVPAWAKQSAANVASCGLLPEGCSFSDGSLTRAQAAEMLCGAMDVLAAR